MIINNSKHVNEEDKSFLGLQLDDVEHSIFF